MPVFRCWVLLLGLLLCFSAKAQYPDGFSIAPLDSLTTERMQKSGVYRAGAPVPLTRLRLLQLRYVDFKGEAQQGQLIVLDACSEAVLRIFYRLYEKGFPLHSIRPIHEFGGNDSLSMAANNSSGFNFRRIAGSDRLSLHAYGTAVDINPVHNPMLDIPCGALASCVHIRPAAGAAFVNRRQGRLNKPKRSGMAETVLDIFSEEGFYAWGGYWDCPIDYQHFEVSRALSELLVALPPEEAKAVFDCARDYFNENGQVLERVWIDYWKVRQAHWQYPNLWILRAF